jgi:hypothetical protein
MKAQEGALYIINIYKGGLTVPYVSIVNKKTQKKHFQSGRLSKRDERRPETDSVYVAITWREGGGLGGRQFLCAIGSPYMDVLLFRFPALFLR